MLKQQLEQDIKSALLSGQKARATVLRGLKSVILYAEVAAGSRQEGLNDEAIIVLFAREAKKRQESANLYVQGGDQTRADNELAEKAIIEEYLPAQLSDDALQAVITDAITETAASGPQAMGAVIALVKQKTAGAADGARIAGAVKQRLQAL